MTTSPIPTAAALALMLFAINAAAQGPPAEVRSQAAAGGTAVTAPQTRPATPPVRVMQLGQQRRQSFERERVLANTNGTVVLPPNVHAQCAQALQRYRSDGAQSVTAGFDTQAGQSGPYVEERFHDGTVIYRFSHGSVVMARNSASYFCPYQIMAMETPRGTPPAIPADGSPQADWVRYHNGQLHAIIPRLVNNDSATLSAIDKAAEVKTHGDLFQMTDFLTGVADFYVGNVP
jgi:hypothetical protein